MVSMPQRDRALGIVQQAQADGATIAAGGTPVGNAGAFLAPTIVSGITPNDSIASEEIFGPVLSVLKFQSDAEAIEIANSTEYGLVGGVFTRDLDRATQSAAGSVQARSS